MTSPFGRTHEDHAELQDDQAVPEDDEMVSQDDPLAARRDDQMVSQDDPLAARADDQMVSQDDPPAARRDDQMVSQDDPLAAREDVVVLAAEDDDEAASEDDEAASEDDQLVPESATWRPVGAGLVGEAPLPARTTGPAHARVDDAADGPDAQPMAASDSSVTTGSDSTGAQWHEILAIFVDNPRASVQQAADLVDGSIEAFVASVKQRQNSLLTIWQGTDADTEELRMALQQYRKFSDLLEGFSFEC